MKILLPLIFLVSCQSKQVDKTIYQPDQIILEAGVIIPTKDGKYTPQFDETFFSKKTVERLETIISNL